jgi:hypothetical protein
VLDRAQADNLPRLVPVNNGFLEGEFIWSAGPLSGFCLFAFGVLWWALSWRLGFSNRWAAIPVVLGIAVMLSRLWRKTKPAIP